MTTQLPVRGTVSPLWPGLIEAYRSRLPVSDSTPVVTLQEGATPLVPARSCPAAPDATSTSRSRGPTRPGRSRTAG
jgi:threonine synthase